MNTLSLGPNTICVEAHEEAYIEQLTKLGIEVVAVPYDKVVPIRRCAALHHTGRLPRRNPGGLFPQAGFWLLIHFRPKGICSPDTLRGLTRFQQSLLAHSL